MDEIEHEARRVIKNLYIQKITTGAFMGVPPTLYEFAKEVKESNHSYSVYASVYIKWKDRTDDIQGNDL